MKIIAITQARFGSSRFPGKVLKKINQETLLAIHLKRALQSRLIDKLIVATTLEPEAQEIGSIALACGTPFYQGSLNDVLDRFYQCVREEHPDYVVRITSDCPLIDPALIDKIIAYTLENHLNYCSNTLDPKYPDGQDVEVFKFAALEKAWMEAKLLSEREHVTPYIWKNSSFKGGDTFKSDNFEETFSYGHLRMTVDEPQDFEVISNLIANNGVNSSWLEYAQYLENNQKLKSVNSAINRNEGYDKSINKDNQ